MVSLSKETISKNVCKVKHLMTEEQAIALEVRETTQPPVTVDIENEDGVLLTKIAEYTDKIEELETELAQTKEIAESFWNAFAWAMFIIFVLLFVFIFVLSKQLNITNSLPLAILQIACGSVALGILMTIYKKGINNG